MDCCNLTSKKLTEVDDSSRSALRVQMHPPILGGLPQNQADGERYHLEQSPLPKHLDAFLERASLTMPPT